MSNPTRRSMIGALASAPFFAANARDTKTGAPAAAPAGSRIMTVRGWCPAGSMGIVLAHEHALANFAAYEKTRSAPHPYSDKEVMSVVLPRLVRLKARGVSTFVDATATFLGRDPVLLRKLSIASGLNILTVTGNYAAFDGRFLPPWAYSDTPSQLAERWIGEWRNGIDGSGVRPGFIKLGFNGGPLSPVERNLIRAAAIAHLRTGLTIGAHTGPAAAAFPQLEELERAGVHPSAWIWIHAQNEPDLAQHVAAGRRGAWVEFDGIDPKSIDLHLRAVLNMADAGLLGRVLISQDAGWYSVGERQGGNSARSYETVFDQFLPALRGHGFSDAEIDQLLIRNPAEAFAVGVRLQSA